MRMGIDVGGTFTDLVLIDDEKGQIHYTKTLTTPDDLAEGVLQGLEKILRLADTGIEAIEYLVHGTTIGTNALIEHKGARVGLITTEGFRDVLEIARIERPDAGLYDMTVDLPEPLVPRYLRLEADERVAADGEVVKALDSQSVIRAVERFRTDGVEAIAIAFLFSFCNPAHERRAREICQELLPDVPVTISSEIAPEFREFERTSTTVINAYLSPITRRYLGALIDRLNQKFGRVDLRIMQTSGGCMTAEAAQSRAVHMVNSGPAGGALASALFGRLAGEERVVCIDMGGTSFDVSLIVDGQPSRKAEGMFEGYPVKVPMIDVQGIGAGGGSIAWVDTGGALNVGPRSAGAEPGPACYGRGGTNPTVSDANLVLGRLNPEYFLGSEMRLFPELAEEAIRRHIAEPLNLTVEEAAVGIIRVVKANMVRGISVNSTQQGFDLRDFALLSFGGAGPLHAVELAQELGIGRVIVPPFCSVFSALGAVASDVRHDFVQTVALPQEQITADKLRSFFADLEARARKQLLEENVPPDSIRIERSADLRYEGQSYELTIPFHQNGNWEEPAVATLIADFHDWHKRIYAYGEPSEPVELINVRLVAVGKVPELRLVRDSGDRGQAPVAKMQRQVYYPGRGFIEAQIFERDTLSAGQRIPGPSLIEEATSTTVIPPGATGGVDAYGNLVIDVH